MAHLVFQLKAPLASFGSSQGELRLSDAVPRKSAVTGMLAAALGLERTQTSEFQALVSAVRMALGVLKEPLKLIDFHTVQGPIARYADSRAEQLAAIRAKELAGEPYKGTVITRREYLQDGHWVVVLDGDAQVLLELKAALEAPKFTLYLGRKSCVLSAFCAPVVTDEQTLEGALRAWEAHAGVPLPAEVVVHWEEGMTSAVTATLSKRKTDVRTRLTHNHFSARNVFEGIVNFKSDVCTSRN